MISKWFELKDKAISLRKNGQSIRDIEKKLGIPRSTLSGWLKDIKLSNSQKKVLDKRWRDALVYARTKSVIWHNAEKSKRIKLAEKEGEKVLNRLKFDLNEMEIALSMLYLGEGFKTGSCTAIGNSDPLILKFFIHVLEKNYSFERNKIKCELHLRADQNKNVIKKFWSKELCIPICNFTSVSFDKRTIGKKTYPNYKGVCVLRFGTVAISRKLVYLSRQFCEIVIKGAVSSVGRAQD
jgi:transcriptional regulator with XRE-family HTH domain